MAPKKPATSTSAPAQSGAPKNHGGKADPFADYKQADEFVQPAGYWDPAAGPLHGVLTSAFEYRQKSGRGAKQLRTVYLFKLLSPCIANVFQDGQQTADNLEPGELCAVYDSVGLKALRDLAGCRVLLERLPEKKELDNGNAMWLFNVRFKGERKPLEIRKAFERSESRDNGDDGDDDGYDEVNPPF